MKTLIYKEFHTVLKPYLFVFALMSLLLLIPSYPYFIALGFMIQGVFLYLNETRTNNDVLFTSILPVSRNRIVLIKHVGAAILEIAALLVAVPFAILSSFVVNTSGNIVGIDANMTLFGLVFIEYALFNLIFFTNYFKTTQKIGVPVLCGLIAFVLFHTVIEILIALVPEIKYALDGVARETAVYRATVLIVGIAVYIGLGFTSYKLSCKNFEKVGL